MVNIEKYKNDGWGLSKKCFQDIENILNTFNNPNIVEFGSGISTEFFVDYLNQNNKNGKIYSFDDNLEYSSKIIDNKLYLKIKKIVECFDHDFEIMFNNKIYDFNKMKYKIKPAHTRQKNCFYDVKNDDFPDRVDLLVVDGPHGNGRSFSFLHLKDKLIIGSYVVIDDYNHYDFCEKFKLIFPNNKLINESTTGSIDQWELGGNYRIYKIL